MPRGRRYALWNQPGVRFRSVLIPFRACIVIIVLTILCSHVRAAAGWKIQSTGTFVWLHTVFFVNANRGWTAGGNGTLFSTSDGGATWRRASRRPTEDALRDIYFVNEKNGWLLCERDLFQLQREGDARTYLLRTTDGGATWTRVDVTGADPDIRFSRAIFTAAGRGWVFGESGTLFATRNNGATWAPQHVFTHYLLLGGEFLDNDGWLVGAGGTILETSDGGETWNPGIISATGDSEAKSARPRFDSVSFADPEHGWAVGTRGAIYATIDRGRTWRPQSSSVTADLLDVKFLDAREGWAAGAEGVIIHTTDGGASWTLEPSGTEHPLERLFFVDRDHGWAVGFGGTIVAYNRGSTESTAPRLRPAN